MLKLICKIYKKHQQNRSIVRQLQRFTEQSVTDKVIVFNTVRDCPKLLHLEYFLGYWLATLGAKVTMLMDDGIFTHWESKQIHEKKSFRKMTPFTQFPRFLHSLCWHLSIKKVISKYHHPNMNVIRYSSFSDISIQPEKEKYGIDLHQYAVSSTKRYYETDQFDPEKHDEYYRMSLFNAAISAETGVYILDNLKPDIFLSSQPIYSVWGPCFEYLRNKGVKCIAHGYHAHYKQRILMSDYKLELLGRSNEWMKFRENSLTEQQRDMTVSYLENRLSMKAIDNRVYFEDVSEKIDLDEIKTEYTIAAFPNVIWDGDIPERNTGFNSIVEWLEETIKFVSQRDDITLLIRFHPAETTLLKGVLSLERIIREKYNPDDLRNVIFLSSDIKINSYKLAKSHLDMAILYDGMLGIELPFLGVPTVLCGNACFAVGGSNKANWKIKTKEEYFGLLGDLGSSLKTIKQESDKEELLKYAYWYLYETSYYLPITDPVRIEKFNFSEMGKEDLHLDKNEKLGRIIKRILGPV